MKKESIEKKLKIKDIEREELILIKNVISQLPEKVQTFALKNIIFMVLSKDGLALSFKPNRTERFIILDEYSLQFYPKKFREQTIAHEIAHAWLGHETKVNECLSVEEIINREKEADKQAKRWGFIEPTKKVCEYAHACRILHEASTVFGETSESILEELKPKRR